MAKSNDKILHLFLSGGVDSTAFTIAFLKASCGDYKNICVMYTKYSVEENPNFIQYLKDIKVPMKEMNVGWASDIEYQNALKNGYTVDGNCCDQLFGQGNLNNNFPELYYKDWKPFINNDVAIQQLEEAFSYYKIPIKTFGEFAWIMNFLCKYNFVKNTDILMSGVVSKNKFNFYDTKEFQDWSVSNFDILHTLPQHIPSNYKRQLKEYIYSFNKDDIYLQTKGKFGSWHYIKSYKDVVVKSPLRICIMETPETVLSHNVNLTLNLNENDIIYYILSKSLFLETTKKYLKEEFYYE